MDKTEYLQVLVAAEQKVLEVTNLAGETTDDRWAGLALGENTTEQGLRFVLLVKFCVLEV